MSKSSVDSKSNPKVSKEKKAVVIHSKKGLRKQMQNVPEEIGRYITSFVPYLSDKRIVNGPENTGLSDERYNNLPAYAKDLAVKLKGYGSYQTTVNTLYRWYVYADQDWDKFLMNYPFSGCVNIYTAQDWVNFGKRYPNNEKCYAMVTNPEWANVMNYDQNAQFISPYAIKKILLKDKFLFDNDINGGKRNTKRLKANMRNTRKNRK